MGYSTVETQQIIEDKGKGNQQKRRVLKIEKEVGPDYKSIVYLLTKHFGREYSERYEEIKLLEKRIEAGKEEWNDGSEQTECSDDEDSGSQGL
jgi:hypothetical protein